MWNVYPFADEDMPWLPNQMHCRLKVKIDDLSRGYKTPRFIAAHCYLCNLAQLDTDLIAYAAENESRVREYVELNMTTAGRMSIKSKDCEEDVTAASTDIAAIVSCLH